MDKGKVAGEKSGAAGGDIVMGVVPGGYTDTVDKGKDAHMERSSPGMEYGCGAGVEYDVDLEEEAEDMNPVDDELAEEVAMDLRGGSIRNDVSNFSVCSCFIIQHQCPYIFLFIFCIPSTY